MEPGSERGAGKHAHIGYSPAELEESLLLTKLTTSGKIFLWHTFSLIKEEAMYEVCNPKKYMVYLSHMEPG